MKFQVGFFASVGGFNDEGGFGGGKLGHVEIELGTAVCASGGGKFLRLSAALDARDDFCARNGGAGLPAANGDVKIGVLAGEPGFWIEKFEHEGKRVRGRGSGWRRDAPRSGGSVCSYGSRPLRRWSFWSCRRRRHKPQRATANLFADGAVLLGDALLQSFLSRGIERQQIEVVVCAAVKNAAAAIDSSVNQRTGGAAVLGLKVIDGFADFHIRVMPEEHIVWLRFLRGALNVPSADVRRRYFPVPFDRLACEWIL